MLHVVSVFFSIPFFFGDQLSHFKGKGYEIHIICSPSQNIKNYSKLHGFKYKEIPVLRKFSIFKDIISVYKIYQYIKSNNIQFVCGHTAKGSLLSMIASFFASVPQRIFFRHGINYETSKGIKKLLMININRITSLLSTKVVCVSPYVIEKSQKDKLTSKNKMILFRKGSCTGIDALLLFNPKEIKNDKLFALRKELNIPPNKFVVGFTGRLVKDKGIVELVEAFRILKKNYENLYLLLVGPLETRDSLPMELVKYIDKEPTIIRTGLIESGIQYYYSLMNLLAFPTHRDGFGTTIIEASSMGIPVITNSKTGSRDAIINNVTGMYIETNSTSISSTIKQYIDNPLLCKNHGNNGRLHVLKNFEQNIIWKEIENKLYKNYFE